MASQPVEGGIGQNNAVQSHPIQLDQPGENGGGVGQGQHNNIAQAQEITQAFSKPELTGLETQLELLDARRLTFEDLKSLSQEQLRDMLAKLNANIPWPVVRNVGLCLAFPIGICGLGLLGTAVVQIVRSAREDFLRGFNEL